jgi:histidine triad (HIT) family protein
LASPDCTFCKIAAGEAPAALVLDEPEVVAFLDVRPVFKGHLLVAPRAHVVTLDELSGALVPIVFGAVQRCAAALPAALGSQGSWVSINNVVSQSVPHLHVHVVPRTRGDGLRGFFWPRTRYRHDAELQSYAARLRDALRS